VQWRLTCWDFVLYDTQSNILAPFRWLWGSRIRTWDSCVLCLVSPSCLSQLSHHIPKIAFGGKRTNLKVWSWYFYQCEDICIYIFSVFLTVHSVGEIFSWQRSGDIIAWATRMLQFSTEMQQIWHTYYPRHQEELLLKMFFYKFRPWTAHNRWISPIFSIFKLSFESSTSLRS
jgi:hypothetical protein